MIIFAEFFVFQIDSAKGRWYSKKHIMPNKKQYLDKLPQIQLKTCILQIDTPEQKYKILAGLYIVLTPL